MPMRDKLEPTGHSEISMQDGYPLGETDARHLACIVSEHYAKAYLPTWAYHARIRMALLLYSSLEQLDGDPYPTTVLTIPELSMAARCKYHLAWTYMRWLIDEGHVAHVTRADGTKALAFVWHIKGAGGDNAGR